MKGQVKLGHREVRNTQENKMNLKGLSNLVSLKHRFMNTISEKESGGKHRGPIE